VDELPHWEPGTPAVLSASGPHAIPLSTAVRAADDRIVFALAHSRETLRRLREDPRAALCLMGAGVAFTAEGEARVIREELEASPHVAALELRVARVHDHLDGSPTEMLDGARWRFSTDEAGAADAGVRAELAGL
jgi:hypothetical protein